MSENKEKPMKNQLLELVEGTQKEHKDIDLKETPIIFKWSYDEEPSIEFQLLIRHNENYEEVVH